MAVREDEMLSEAVQKNDVNGVQSALALGANPNSWIPVHQHMLLAASYNGSPDAVDLLLQAGANAIATDRDEQNIYHKAAQGIALEEHLRAGIVRRAKDVGPDPDDPDKRGMPAIGYAAINDLSAVIHALVIDCGADRDATDREGNTAAHIAAASNNGDALYMLLLMGADVEAKNDSGLSVRYLANDRTRQNSVDAISRYDALPDIDVNTVEPTLETLTNPKLWCHADAVFESWRARGVNFDAQMLNQREGSKQSPCDLALLCGKLTQALDFVQESHDITPQHLRNDEGKPTPLQDTLTRAGQCGMLFRAEAWKGKSGNDVTTLYQALSAEGRKQVQNYHLLREELRTGQSTAERGR